ncbi:MAG: hypothetical protein ACI9MR_004691 [Myxococcota bacterium]|jgi:hypothetical protein
MSTFTDDATKFATGPASIDAARALSDCEEADLLALVMLLEQDKQRAHLEAMAEAGFPKAVKKGARKAAYKLKSQGVAGEVAPSQKMDLAVEVDLKNVAIVGAPGLDGHVWMVLSDLSGVEGAEVDVRGEEQAPTVRVLEDLSRNRVRKVFNESGSPRPLLVDASAAVRVIERVEATLNAATGGAPLGLAHIKNWAEVAKQHGADPTLASARAQLAGPYEIEETLVEALFKHPKVAFMAPPSTCLAPIEARFGALMHSDEVTEEADFRATLDVIVSEAADLWFAAADTRGKIVARLEDDADILFIHGEHDLARTCLALSDAAAGHTGSGSSWGFLQRAFQAVVDYNSAWAHRKAHIEGHAHH